MVHSGSAHPIPTTPSASPHLTAPAPAPPLQAPLPLAQPLPNPTDEGLTQTPDKLLTPVFTASSVSIQSSITTSSQTLTLTPAKAQNTNSGPILGQSETHISTPSEIIINGRSSGRKRTPKLCDCCGPNSKGHNAKTPVRTVGRGSRARGRGRGKGRNLSECQLTTIKNFEMTEEENVDEDGAPVVAVIHEAIESGPATDLTMPFPSNEALIRKCASEEMGGIQKNEKVMESHGGTLMRKRGGSSRVSRMRLGGTRGRGALLGEFRGRGRKGVASTTLCSDMELSYFSVAGGRLISSETECQAESVSLQEEEEKAEMEQGENTCTTVAVSSLANGELINLCQEETIEEAGESGINTDAGVTEPISGGKRTAESDSGEISDAQLSYFEDPGLAMQVDQPSDGTVLVPLVETLSNGNSSPPTDQDHSSVSTGEQTFYPAFITNPSQDAIVMHSTQYCWALRDHRLYCIPGTWKEVVNEKEEHGVRDALGNKEDSDDTKRCHSDRQMDGHTQDEESLQQLIEIVHEFLESFYVKYGSFIPLSESDVLEHLKKTGYWDPSNRKLDIPGEVRRYRAGLASVPVAGFMVTYNKQTLSLEDLGTLEEQNWVNDQIINMYGELIMATHEKVHFFNSFFHKQLVAKGYEGVKRWTKKVDLFSKQLLLVPIHLEIHWSLITVEIATKTISYYDSQGIVIRYNIDSIQKYLESEAREKKQTAYQKGWKLVFIKGIPQQKNDSDCGVFVLEYCRRLSVKQPMHFSQEDMPRIRKRIYKELCDCCLND